MRINTIIKQANILGALGLFFNIAFGMDTPKTKALKREFLNIGIYLPQKFESKSKNSLPWYLKKQNPINNKKSQLNPYVAFPSGITPYSAEFSYPLNLNIENIRADARVSTKRQGGNLNELLEKKFISKEMEAYNKLYEDGHITIGTSQKLDIASDIGFATGGKGALYEHMRTGGLVNPLIILPFVKRMFQE